MSHWFLEFFVSGGKTLKQIPLDKFPFTVGRSSRVALTINSPDVSRNHGEFIKQGDAILLRDNESTNGIFLNHKKIDNTSQIKHGDVIHFANVEFRVICEEEAEIITIDQTLFGIQSLTNFMPKGLMEFQELLEKAQVTFEFQPVVTPVDHETYGYEILGRGCHPSLPSKPCTLFKIAESTNKEIEFSELLMTHGLSIADRLNIDFPFFINTHPREMEDIKRLLDNLKRLRLDRHNPMLILEIHEEAVTDLSTIKELKTCLKDLNIKLAYDDFGAGQARLMELVDAPPDFLKFDIQFIKNIDTAPPMMVHMIEALLKISRESGITTLAEGIDSKEKNDICKELGFDLVQGFYFPSIFPNTSQL